MDRKPKARLGRPPASDSAVTQQRILVEARRAFAELGYGVTTNRDVALRAGITTGALYHYFDSKSAMYWAVFDHAQRTVGAYLHEALHQHTTFVEQFEAFLRALHRLHNEEPSLAHFLNAARVDTVRYGELQVNVDESYPGVKRHFIPGMVALGVRTGELRAEQQAHVEDFMHAFVTGVMDSVSISLDEQRRAMDAMIALIRGQLISPVAVPAVE